MKLTLDTSAISAFGRGSHRHLDKWFTAKHELLVPLIVVGELRAGFVHGTQRQQNEKLLQKFLDAPNVSTISLGDNTTKLYATIYQNLKRVGKPINTNDMWIAALTQEHDCSLVTLDSDFSNVPDLSIVAI